MRFYFSRWLCIWCLLASFCGCSPQNFYPFQVYPQLASPIRSIAIRDSGAVPVSQQLLVAAVEKQNHNLAKTRSTKPEIFPSELIDQGITALNPNQGLQEKGWMMEEISKQRFAGKKQARKGLSAVLQKFPVVWFIILSGLLAILLILFAASEPGMPSFEELYLILMIPIAIPWLIILAKALAPALGWPAFWTFMAMVGAIVLFILFCSWLANVQEKARKARYLKSQEERQKRDPATY